jgi:hypothetical protein
MQLYLLMMGLDGPETCRGLRNILRISCESSWFFFTRLYRDARSTEHYYYFPPPGLPTDLGCIYSMLLRGCVMSDICGAQFCINFVIV